MRCSKERIDTTYGDIAEFGGEGPETRRINVEGDGFEWVQWSCANKTVVWFKTDHRGPGEMIDCCFATDVWISVQPA